MQQTTNYNLNVIEQSDKILDSVTALGQNATSIDTILAGKQDNITIATSISSSSTNNDVAGAKAVYDAMLDNYSTTEHIVGTWIDGKPLYRKVVTLTTLPNNTTKNFAHGISNLEQVVQSTGTIWWSGSPKEGNLLPYISSSSNFVSLYWNATNVTVRASGDYSGRNGVAILYYTKTTDTATRSLNLMKSDNEEETEEKELEEKEPIVETTENTKQNNESGDLIE